MKISPKHCKILQNSTGKTQGGVAGGGEWGDRGDIWDRTWVATKWTCPSGLHWGGKSSLARHWRFCASRSITCFTAILFWIVLDVRLLPELVRPGLVAELQLRTVPFSNCLAKILRIVDVAGSLIPGNLTLKRWRRSGKKFLPPLLLMIFHHKEVPVLEVKLWCHQSTYKKLCKEFRLIRSTTGYLCLVFKILRRNRRRSGGRGGALPSAPGPENRITSGWPEAEHTTDWES